MAAPASPVASARRGKPPMRPAQPRSIGTPVAVAPSAVMPSAISRTAAWPSSSAGGALTLRSCASTATGDDADGGRVERRRRRPTAPPSRRRRGRASRTRAPPIGDARPSTRRRRRRASRRRRGCAARLRAGRRHASGPATARRARRPGRPPDGRRPRPRDRRGGGRRTSRRRIQGACRNRRVAGAFRTRRPGRRAGSSRGAGVAARRGHSCSTNWMPPSAVCTVTCMRPSAPSDRSPAPAIWRVAGCMATRAPAPSSAGLDPRRR